MSPDREQSATRLAVECPLCHETIPAGTALVDHFKRGHSKGELAAYIERSYEETL